MRSADGATTGDERRESDDENPTRGHGERV
jgi:hypothetical protein